MKSDRCAASGTRRTCVTASGCRGDKICLWVVGQVNCSENALCSRTCVWGVTSCCFLVLSNSSWATWADSNATAPSSFIISCELHRPARMNSATSRVRQVCVRPAAVHLYYNAPWPVWGSVYTIRANSHTCKPAARGRGLQWNFCSCVYVLHTHTCKRTKGQDVGPPLPPEMKSWRPVVWSLALWTTKKLYKRNKTF